MSMSHLMLREEKRQPQIQHTDRHNFSVTSALFKKQKREIKVHAQSCTTRECTYLQLVPKGGSHDHVRK